MSGPSATAWRFDCLPRGDRRVVQQQGLVRLLQLATTPPFSQPSLIEAFACDHRRPYRWRLRRLARRLAAGTPLADAVEQTPGVLSPAATLAIRFGSQMGLLAKVLDMLARTDAREALRVVQRVRQTAGYVLFVLVMLLQAGIFLLLKIAPQYRQIFDDFELAGTGLLDGIVWLAAWGEHFAPLLLLLALMAGIVGCTRWGVRYFQNVWLPRISPSVAQLRHADLLQLLAMALRGGRPLSSALSTLARYHYDPGVRHRLLYVRNELEQGADPWNSLVEVGLITAADRQAVAVAPDAISRAWTLERLVEVRRQRVFRRCHAALDLIHPLCLLALAAIVLLVVLAFFHPLVSLIENIA